MNDWKIMIPVDEYRRLIKNELKYQVIAELLADKESSFLADKISAIFDLVDAQEIEAQEARKHAE